MKQITVDFTVDAGARKSPVNTQEWSDAKRSLHFKQRLETFFSCLQLYIDVTNNDFKGSSFLPRRFGPQTKGGSLLALNVERPPNAPPYGQDTPRPARRQPRGADREKCRQLIWDAAEHKSNSNTCVEFESLAAEGPKDVKP